MTEFNYFKRKAVHTRIVKSNANCSDLTLVESMNTNTVNGRPVYLGHWRNALWLNFTSSIWGKFALITTGAPSKDNQLLFS